MREGKVVLKRELEVREWGWVVDVEGNMSVSIRKG